MYGYEVLCIAMKACVWLCRVVYMYGYRSAVNFLTACRARKPAFGELG